VSEPIKSAARVLEVLEHFRSVREPQSRKQVTEALGYPQSSTTMLLKSLIALGYLSYDSAARVYFPTLRVAALGDWVGHALLGRGQMAQAMQDLHAATGETVSLGLQNDIHMQYVRVIQSVHALRFHTEEGSQRPLLRSVLGWVLMSTHDDAAVERLLRRANQALRAAERVNVLEMLKTVAALRGQAVAYAENVPLPGGATLCTLLPVSVHGRPVVLGLGGAIDRIRAHRARYTQALLKAARSVKRAAAAEAE
jgi:IclR family transcriptional regulator, KDG regulon repressor